MSDLYPTSEAVDVYDPSDDVEPLLDTAAYSLSDAQVQMADLIVEEFLAAGFGYPVAAAAVVNAYRESSFNANKGSDTGRYVGLFQLSPDILASVADRKDPRKNTRGIISEAKRAKEFMRAAKGSSDISYLAGEFAYWVERPLDKPGEKKLRSEMAARMYPQACWQNTEDALTPRVPEEEEEEGSLLTDPAVQLAVLGAVVVALIALRVRQKRQAPAAGSLRRSLPR
jgi:hypothetical protein